MLALTGLEQAAYEPAYWGPRPDYDRGAHTAQTYFQAVGEQAGARFDSGQIDALIEADNELWTQVNQPMVDFALRLQAAGMPTGILSNLGDALTAGVLERFPALDGFTHRTWSHALKMAKPEPAIYAHAAAGLGVLPAHILFIDDRLDNLEGAAAAGMQTIQYAGQPAFEAELLARGLGELWRTGVPLPYSRTGTSR